MSAVNAGITWKCDMTIVYDEILKMMRTTLQKIEWMMRIGRLCLRWNFCDKDLSLSTEFDEESHRQSTATA